LVGCPHCQRFTQLPTQLARGLAATANLFFPFLFKLLLKQKRFKNSFTPAQSLRPQHTLVRGMGAGWVRDYKKT